MAFTISYSRAQDYKEAKRNCPRVLCMDSLQKEIFANMYFAACSYIGSLENTTYDWEEESEEYQSAIEELENHEGLIECVHAMCLSGFYSCGLEAPKQNYQKIYNTAGSEWIRKCAEDVVTAMGR